MLVPLYTVFASKWSDTLSRLPDCRNGADALAVEEGRRRGVEPARGAGALPLAVRARAHELRPHARVAAVEEPSSGAEERLRTF